jgi:hypothetical protein
MYRICPKCGHVCEPFNPSPDSECAACGLVFGKWLKSLVVDEDLARVMMERQAPPTFTESVRDFLFPPRPDIGRMEFPMLVIIFLVFTAWGIHFIGMDFRNNEIGRSFLHNVDLIFHEAGHFFFIPLGHLMMLIGGSLFQVLLPFILVFAFLLVNRDGFGASICLWWTGQSLMDLAPYIADARAMRLPLLGGGTGVDSPGLHDWNNILGYFGWLEYDIQIANWVDIAGSTILVVALLWGLTMLVSYYRELYS